MKDITIPGKRVKTEIIYFLSSLAAAIILNIHAIYKFDSPWTEIFTQLHIVLIIAIVIYILLLLIRAILNLSFKVFRRR